VTRSSIAKTAFDCSRFDVAYRPGIASHFWHYARSRIILRKLKGLAYSGKLGRVLEIGAGRCIVLAYLRQNEIDCRGVELSPIAVPADLPPYLQTGAGSFDLDVDTCLAVEFLRLLDVLEHLPDPVVFLGGLRVAYRMEGVIDQAAVNNGRLQRLMRPSQ
jgi:hypothetical protein